MICHKHKISSATGSCYECRREARDALPTINPSLLSGEIRAHSHYFKDVSKLQTVDVYRALTLFAVTDPCLQHAIKKLLVAGGRGGGKDISRDIGEAIDTLKRWQEMRAEEAAS